MGSEMCIRDSHPAPGLGTSALVAEDVGTPPRLEGGFLLLSGEDGP